MAVINYTLTNQAVLLDEVEGFATADGVEVQTKQERHVIEWYRKQFIARSKAYMDDQLERALYGEYYDPKLPTP